MSPRQRQPESKLDLLSRREFLAGAAMVGAGLLLESDSDIGRDSIDKTKPEQTATLSTELNSRETLRARYSKWKLKYNRMDGSNYDPRLKHSDTVINETREQLLKLRQRFEAELSRKIENSLRLYSKSADVEVERVATLYPDVSYAYPMEADENERQLITKAIKDFAQEALNFWDNSNLESLSADDIELFFYDKLTQITNNQGSLINTRHASKQGGVALNVGSKEENRWPYKLTCTANTTDGIKEEIEGEITLEEGVIGGGLQKVYSIKEFKDGKISQVGAERMPIIIFASADFPLEVSVAAEILHFQFFEIFKQYTQKQLIGLGDTEQLEVNQKLKNAMDLEEMAVHAIHIMFLRKKYREDEGFRKRFDDKINNSTDTQSSDDPINLFVKEMKKNYKGLGRVLDHFSDQKPKQVIDSLLSYIKNGVDSQLWEQK